MLTYRLPLPCRAAASPLAVTSDHVVTGDSCAAVAGALRSGHL